jgi:glycosyltransferase involved in cell wall biosynthesis
MPGGGRRRVVILTEDSKPSLGGIAEYLHQLGLAATATHDVLIVTSVRGASALNADIPFRYREERWYRAQERRVGDNIPLLRRVNTLVWRAGQPGRAVRLLAAIHAQRPDSSYVLGRLSPVTMPWCMAFASLGIPYAAIGYGLEVVEPLSWMQTKRRIACAVAADHWFAISSDTRDKLVQLGVPASRQSLLLPGVAAPSTAPTLGFRREVRQRFGLGDDPFIFSLSYLRRRKGIDLGIEAFAAVASEFPDLRYVIAGHGPEAESLAALARARGVDARATFVGSVDDAEKTALFADCEFFLLPNRAELHDVEGFGIVFLEAGLFGKAVIGGNNGGVPEAVVNETTGLLVDTRDASELTAAVRRLLREPLRAAEMGRQGRERARRDFSWAQRGATFVEQLDALAARPPRPGRRRSTPLSRLRREVGHTSNRLVSGASVLGGVLGRGRLAAYLLTRGAPATNEMWVAEMLGWLDLAFAAGVDGGVAANYHVVRGWAASYPEVTGYLIPTLLEYSVTRRDPALRERARRAGEWLARTRLPGGAVCRKQWFEGNTAPSVFNTAQVIDGWCALERAAVPPVDDSSWLALARRSGDWLLTEQEVDGSWVRNAFNGIPHTYYARVAAPLAQLARESGDSRYAEAAHRALDWVVSRQTRSGWFQDAGFTSHDPPTTHTIGYVIEGLLTGAALLGEPKFADAAARAADHLLSVYSAARSVPGQFAAEWRSRSRWRCLTGDAQVAGAWALLYRRTGDTRYHRAAAAMADDIRDTVRVTAHWPEISGAVQGSSPPWGDYDSYAYPTHAVKFSLDLLTALGE